MHLVPDGEERDMSDDDDRDFFSDAFEVRFKPALLCFVNPAEVVSGLWIESDGIEMDEVPSEVGVAVERIFVSELFNEQ
jgi:hypothetical protein